MSFLSYDPVTGVRHDFDYDEVTGNAYITYSQDVQAVLDRNQRLRAEGTADKGIKAGWWQYASIPLTVVMEMKSRGIDLFKAKDVERVFQEIDERYPYLKLTDKHHGRKRKDIYLG